MKLSGAVAAVPVIEGAAVIGALIVLAIVGKKFVDQLNGLGSGIGQSVFDRLGPSAPNLSGPVTDADRARAAAPPSPGAYPVGSGQGKVIYSDGTVQAAQTYTPRPTDGSTYTGSPYPPEWAPDYSTYYYLIGAGA